jgi:hypothetical protein
MDVPLIIDGITKASQQSDRWLFIALLAIGILSLYALAKYFTGQIAGLASKHDDLNKYVRDEQSQLIRQCTAALEANTHALEQVRFSQQRKASQS